MKKLLLGYSPFNSPSFHPIRPFNEVFHLGVNLINASQKEFDTIDALLLWGGADISPSMYDEHPFIYSGPAKPTERDVFEWELCRRAYDRGIPIIGVCRGAQLLCAFAGGKLVQDVNGHNNGHHDIVVQTEPGKTETFSVSSSHHQMMYPYDVEHELIGWVENPLSNKYEPNYKLYCAEMDKGHYKEAEVVYFPKVKGFAMQCHPEWHLDNHPFNKWMFSFINNRLLNQTEQPSCEC